MQAGSPVQQAPIRVLVLNIRVTAYNPDMKSSEEGEFSLISTQITLSEQTNPYNTPKRRSEADQRSTRRPWTSVNPYRFAGTSPSHSCDVQRRSESISRPGDKEAESATPLASSLPLLHKHNKEIRTWRYWVRVQRAPTSGPLDAARLPGSTYHALASPALSLTYEEQKY
ncbi:hypothetical protein EYF80_043472 [Liparis tanakae]|uniref:Uncharacterized protein n=1 Tax=Liparis tanakae TaxID=230148 RepID=A0A4Z2G0B5_9TELE|nr:hypothetical protein EYF80_043472 [Liparis tanakae]